MCKCRHFYEQGFRMIALLPISNRSLPATSIGMKLRQSFQGHNEAKVILDRTLCFTKEKKYAHLYS